MLQRKVWGLWLAYQSQGGADLALDPDTIVGETMDESLKTRVRDQLHAIKGGSSNPPATASAPVPGSSRPVQSQVAGQRRPSVPGANSTRSGPPPRPKPPRLRSPSPPIATLPSPHPPTPAQPSRQLRAAAKATQEAEARDEEVRSFVLYIARY